MPVPFLTVAKGKDENDMDFVGTGSVWIELPNKMLVRIVNEKHVQYVEVFDTKRDPELSTPVVFAEFTPNPKLRRK